MWNDCEEMVAEFEPALKVFLQGLACAALFVVVGWWVMLMMWATLSPCPTPAPSTPMADEPTAESFADHAGGVVNMQGA